MCSLSLWMTKDQHASGLSALATNRPMAAGDELRVRPSVDCLIWCLRLTDVPAAAMRGQLTDAEHRRADRLRIKQDVERFVKTRGALRVLLAVCTGQSVRGLSISEGNGRKPELVT